MTTNLKHWLTVSLEENEAGPVLIQEEGDGGRVDPKSAAKATTDEDLDVAKPAKASIDAASDDAPKQKVIDQGSQEIRISAEEVEDVEFLEQSDEGDDKQSDGDEGPEGEGDPNAEVKTAKAEESTVKEPVSDAEELPEGEQVVSADAKETKVVVISDEDNAEVESDVPAIDTEATVDVDFSTDGGSSDPAVQEELDKVEDDVAHFTKVAEALEVYSGLIETAIHQEAGITGINARTIAVGMETLDEYLTEGMEAEISLESFDHEDTRLEVTNQFLEFIQAKRKDVDLAIANAKQRNV